MKMYLNEAELVASPSLHQILTNHFEDWMDDDYNRNINDVLGHFFPHFELIEAEMCDKEMEDTTEYRELDALIDFVGNGDLKVYL